jgi:hypothetical protein
MRDSRRIKKNPAAVALAKLGASKGGKARSAALTAHERTAIASLATQNRSKNLSAEERSALARRAAESRWKRTLKKL